MVSSGVKVLVLAVIVGIGTGLFAEFQVAPAEPSVDFALVIMLASLALLALGIFGPGIATGLVSGSPQLGAGAMAGATLGAAGTAVALGAAATGVGGAVVAGARMAPGAVRMATGGASSMKATASGASSVMDSAAANTKHTTASGGQPAWARQLQRRQQLSHTATTVAHTLRGGDGGGSGTGPSLNDPDS